MNRGCEREEDEDASKPATTESSSSRRSEAHGPSKSPRIAEYSDRLQQRQGGAASDRPLLLLVLMPWLGSPSPSPRDEGLLRRLWFPGLVAAPRHLWLLLALLPSLVDGDCCCCGAALLVVVGVGVRPSLAPPVIHPAAPG